MEFKWNQKRLLFIFSLFCALFFNPRMTFAADVYKTFTQNGYGEVVPTQDAYLAEETFSVFGEEILNKPTDMKFGANNEIYISDSGNKRIVVVSKKGEYLREITAKEFAHPMGIFVTKQGELYVADDTAGKVFVFDKNDRLIYTFGKPKAPSFGEKSPFSPTKLTVDDRGNVYVISRGNNNGLILLNKDVEGEFLGYFAPNATSNSLLTTFRKMIFSEEQLDKMLNTTPDSATNVNIDSQGLVYTVTPNENSRNVVKKLNMGGMNLLKDNYLYFPSGIAIGELDNIFVVGEDGYIYEYTSEGEFLFMFAGKNDGKQRKGLVEKGVAILVDEQDKVYTLDEKNNEIQVFTPTEFTNTLHQALNLYQLGRYKQSKALWSEVLKMNSQFDFASLGIGEAYFKEEAYHDAMDSFKRAKDKRGYSDAFWEVRNVWIRQNVVKIFGAIVTLMILVGLIRRYGKKTKTGRLIASQYRAFMNLKLVKELSFVKYYLLHPIDGAYGIKKEQKTSNLSVLILSILGVLIFVMNKYFTGFIFLTIREGEYTVFQDIFQVILIFAAISVATYLVCTISDGSSTFRNLFHGLVYSLAPYLMIKPFVILVSNVLTFNEVFILNFANTIIYAWLIVLVVISIKELNEYTLMKTFKVIFLSGFTIFLASLSLFILYSLFQQMSSFVTALYGEVVHRFEN